MAEQSINIPQVLVFLVVTFLAIRWYFSKPSTAGTRAAPTRTPTRINPAQIDTIASMFPQLSRRDIAWDLQRNGGNATATTERVLSGRGLDTAPPGFNLPATAPPVAARMQATGRPMDTVKPKPQPDLITRYNLAGKLQQTEEETEQAKPKAWSADRNERQMNLQRRREEMILAARRKMEAKEKGKGKSVEA